MKFIKNLHQGRIARMQNNNKFNNLEEAVLKWFSENYKDVGFISQINAARLKERKWTKAGFYIDLQIPNNVQKIDWSNFKIQGFPIPGPKIESDGIELGGDVLLWGEGEYIGQIELSAFGSFFKEDIENFKLKSN